MSDTDKETSMITQEQPLPSLSEQAVTPILTLQKIPIQLFSSSFTSLLTIAAPTLCLTNNQRISRSSSSQCPEIYSGSVPYVI